MNVHRDAVAAAIAAAGNRLGPTDRPLLQLLQTLAEQMDTAGPNPSTRLSACYLSAVKDLRRALDLGPAATVPSAAGNRLAQLRAVHAMNRPGESGDSGAVRAVGAHPPRAGA